MVTEQTLIQQGYRGKGARSSEVGAACGSGRTHARSWRKSEHFDLRFPVSQETVL